MYIFSVLKLMNKILILYKGSSIVLFGYYNSESVIKFRLNCKILESLWGNDRNIVLIKVTPWGEETIRKKKISLTRHKCIFETNSTFNLHHLCFHKLFQ